MDEPFVSVWKSMWIFTNSRLKHCVQPHLLENRWNINIVSNKPFCHFIQGVYACAKRDLFQLYCGRMGTFQNRGYVSKYQSGKRWKFSAISKNQTNKMWKTPLRLRSALSPGWSRQPAPSRGDILFRLIRQLEDKQEELSALIVEEDGQNIARSEG